MQPTRLPPQVRSSRTASAMPEPAKSIRKPGTQDWLSSVERASPIAPARAHNRARARLIFWRHAPPCPAVVAGSPRDESVESADVSPALFVAEPHARYS